MISKINWNKLLALCGGLVLIISLIIFKGVYDKMSINENGEQVLATIKEAPLNCEKVNSRTGYCKLEFEGKIYIKRAGKKFCHLVSNRKVVKVLTDENRTNLLFPEEYESSQFTVAFIMMFISLLIIFKGLFPKKVDYEND